ncbi:MAG: M6 family metalloprotease domain-containing protein, partial [Lepagella sp.]
MKRSLLLASLMSLASFGAMAVPAFPGPQTAIQPDGSKITYILQGDEFASQMISTDGYLLTRLDDGSICYADRAADGTLHPSIQAHDVRSAAELNFLSNRAKATSLKAPTRPVYTPEKAVVSDNFRGLVILVNYTNQKLCVPNADLFYDQMINTRDFTGYDGQDGNFVEVTGSVRDYFRDNSGGNFDPEFDVVGPVELAVPSSFPMQMQNATQLIILAMNAADPLVDYSNYDSDGDGKIDMVYFIFAGQGSNYTGGSEIWPHKSEILGMQYDGVYTGTYACSAELSGQPNQVQIDGIGTICHEFSHVLGMVDEYDTDYEGSGGEADHPNTWSLMSMGCYTNYGRTPVGYSAYERIQAGFLQPEEITQSGSYSLPDFETSGKAFLINSIVGDEFFILENRQPVKWDKALPGHGMLAYRVDRTDPTLWSTNRVNRNPNHPCYLMLSADPQFGGAFNRREDTEHDTFPGAGNVTELTNTTYPSLQSYYGFNSNVTIHQIAEEDGVISFVADAIPNQSYTEQWSHLFDNAVSGAFKGSIASWTPASGAEIDRDNSRITFIKKSQITSDPIPGKVSLVKFPIYNPTSASAMFQVKYSLDGGNSWKVVNNMAGDDRVSLDANTECVASFSFDEIDLDNNADLQIRVIEFSGVTNQRCSIGDMEFYMVRPSVSVEGLAFMLTEDDYIVATDPKCEVSFFYRGDDTINSVDYSWTLGEAAGTGSYSFPEPLNKDDNSNHVASISLEDVGLVGDYELTMELTAVNGVDLSEPLAAVSPVNVHVIPFMPVKRPLVEEFTGLNCTACPKGYVFMEQMRRDKEDLFVGMAYHSETFENQAINGMVVLHNNDFPVAVQSITSASADRNGISKIDDMTIEWNRAAAE